MSFPSLLTDADVLSLVRRKELLPNLLRCHLEEQIIALVPLDDWLEKPFQPRMVAYEDYLREKG